MSINSNLYSKLDYLYSKEEMISKCIHLIFDNLPLILVVGFLGFILYYII